MVGWTIVAKSGRATLAQQRPHNKKAQQGDDNHHQGKSDGIRKVSDTWDQIQKTQTAPRTISLFSCFVPQRAAALWALAGSGRHTMSAVWT